MIGSSFSCSLKGGGVGGALPAPGRAGLDVATSMSTSIA
jgi:hypothetical protein